jgi:hypothetical protein
MLLELATTYLGPARVLQVADKQLLLELPDARAWGQTALAYPYQPQPGDTVLAVGQEDQWYVIGVLDGTGVTTFTAPADLRLLAPRGKIDLVSAGGVSIRSPTVQIVADRVEITAQVLLEKSVSAYRWVTGLFQVRAGQLLTTVKDTYRLKAEHIRERARADVHIDGRQIHLG